MKSIFVLLHNYKEAKSAIDNVGVFNLINEWRAHNLLYKLGIEKDRTKSVDLNTDNSWYIKVLYTILSIFYTCYS